MLRPIPERQESDGELSNLYCRMNAGAARNTLGTWQYMPYTVCFF